MVKELLPCGHFFHEWCLNQILETTLVKCSIDHLVIQSVSHKVRNRNRNGIGDVDDNDVDSNNIKDRNQNINV